MKRGSAAIASFLFMVIGASSAVSAQETLSRDEQARMHFEAGLLHYREGAYDRALVEFERSWELSRRPILLLNLATVKERLGRHTEAADHLREYLRLVPDAETRPQLERRIANLERIAREQAAAADGGEGATTGPANGAGATEPASGADEGLLAGAIAGWSVAGVGAVMMGVFGGLALAEESALAGGCGQTGACSDAEVADANTFALVSDIGLGAAVAGAAAGAVLLILAFTSGDDAPRAHATLAPWLSPGGGGLWARVAF